MLMRTLELSDPLTSDTQDHSSLGNTGKRRHHRLRQLGVLLSPRLDFEPDDRPLRQAHLVDSFQELLNADLSRIAEGGRIVEVRGTQGEGSFIPAGATGNSGAVALQDVDQTVEVLLVDRVVSCKRCS